MFRQLGKVFQLIPQTNFDNLFVLIPVDSFTKEVNMRLVKRPLVVIGRLANRGFTSLVNKQRVLMHGHQGWNVRHGLCHIYMIYVYIWVVYSFCLFCCLFIIVTTQFVALYKPCKPKPKPSTYDPPDNHPLAEIQIPILRPEPKQQICHQHANTDHFGK